MSKIVSAANAMIANHKKINPVLSGRDDEIFFTYDSKYNWSILKRGQDISLFYYPTTSRSLEQLANVEDPQEWEYIPMVAYRGKELGTVEAEQTFAELYTLIKEKVFGVDDVLDDIIGDMF